MLGALVGSHDAVAALSLDLSRSDLNWLILRPSLLLDGPGIGTVSLGPAEFHARIARDDVAATLVELIHEPRIGRQILELNTGTTPSEEAVRANVCS
ncbi:NAD(P)H-binding protein [Streptomyces canus]|uniref:NAD(P)H-binding protein n=1 Tax=Streptomyces canus TaxID=58343 RepID=UPI003865BA7A